MIGGYISQQMLSENYNNPAGSKLIRLDYKKVKYGI